MTVEVVLLEFAIAAVFFVIVAWFVGKLSTVNGVAFVSASEPRRSKALVNEFVCQSDYGKLRALKSEMCQVSISSTAVFSCDFEEGLY